MICVNGVWHKNYTGWILHLLFLEHAHAHILTCVRLRLQRDEEIRYRKQFSINLLIPQFTIDTHVLIVYIVLCGFFLPTLCLYVTVIECCSFAACWRRCLPSLIGSTLHCVEYFLYVFIFKSTVDEVLPPRINNNEWENNKTKQNNGQVK